MAKAEYTEEQLRMVDAMIAGGQSLDQIETCFKKKNGGLKGIVAAVAKRRAEKSVSTHANPQPSGPPLDRDEAGAAQTAGNEGDVSAMTLV